jgi:hypothetical protein
MIRDNSMHVEARRYLMKGEGIHPADGLALELGYEHVNVKPFSTAGADVWFFRANDPCNCRSHHVEFGVTGGEIIVEGDEKISEFLQKDS